MGVIRVYGMRVPQEVLPEDLLAALDAQWYDAWRKTHQTGRRQERTAESLAALVLLGRVGVSGVLCYEAGGRPFLEGGAIDFSITHAGEFVFCAVGEAGDGTRIGIDAEPQTRIPTLDHMALAARWLAPKERELYQKTPDGEAFLRLWTRKEAAVKAEGRGLSSLAATDTVALEQAGVLGFTTWKTAGQILTVCHSPAAAVDTAVIFFGASE